ncbi:bifunctional tetrahydrofolate synthase/dihydrofolate synthase [Alteromonas facilis]|uniref:bifunctional tetrahydrofolate synthase/dihydrofolate synthase n=1 Tax=Alteromonas facilis TaxID=2048004 RepID=UPI000C292BE0|nr:bifunctional tetrahydrofolate synthase/dihydrofolate synthase [Alteromonas facilis]
MTSSNSCLATAKTTWSLAQWLNYLLAIHPTEIDMGLDRLNRVFQRLQLSFPRTQVITVAGTNGKGSTCRFIELALLSMDKSVVVYSSPHISDYRERVRVNGAMLPAQVFCKAFVQIERLRGEDTLTYFEFGTLAALLLAFQKSPDYLILEVGLGGRLDATNIIDTDLAVITSIDLDHESFLGSTRESVAYEKAGIFRPNVPIVLGDRDTPSVMLNSANQHARGLLVKGANFDITVKDNGTWSWRSENNQLTELPKPLLLRDNLSTAFAALEQLGLLPQLLKHQDDFNSLVATASLPGRMQIIQSEPLWLIDVGHNPHAAKAIATHIAGLDKQSVYIIVGMMKDKSIADTLHQFASLSPKWLTVSLPGERAASAADIARLLSAESVLGEFANVAEAVSRVKAHVTEQDIVLVFGSFVTVDQILTLQEQNAL